MQPAPPAAVVVAPPPAAVVVAPPPAAVVVAPPPAAVVVAPLLSFLSLPQAARSITTPTPTAATRPTRIRCSPPVWWTRRHAEKCGRPDYNRHPPGPADRAAGLPGRPESTRLRLEEELLVLVGEGAGPARRPDRGGRARSGSASTISNAASRARPTSSRSRRSEASFRSLRPFCAVLMIVPSPRSSRSTSASSNPSVVRHAAPRRRGDALAVGPAVTSQHVRRRPRPARPGRAAGGAGRCRSGRRRGSPSPWRSGTSTPTSITVVATSTSSSPRAEAVHHRLLLGRRQAPVQQRRGAGRPARRATRRSKVSSADATSSFSLSSISGHTT